MPAWRSATSDEVRTVALDQVGVEEGFNLRSRLDRGALERLTGPIRQQGACGG
jgi:hypothetical protein